MTPCRDGHIHVVSGGKLAGTDEGLAGLGDDCEVRLLILRDGKMEVTPVDAQIIAGAAEDVLVTGAYGKHVLSRSVIERIGDWLGLLIHRHEPVESQQEGE